MKNLGWLILIFVFLQCKNQPEATKPTDNKAVIEEEIIKPNVPEWLHTAVFYEVYPQTFYDGNGDGIGDISGLIQKLDYIKSTGANAIWMNPVFVSPFRDAGYDVADYYKVAPRYGTNEDAKRLFSEVRKRNMHIIIDCIFGHTSIDHPWFQQSCQTDSNKFTNRYIWTNSTWKKFDMCGQTDGTVINGYCNRDGNFLTNFFWAQPSLNFGYANPNPVNPWELSIDHPSVKELREEMKKFLRFWLDMGADGFHMDMASSLVKGDTINKVGEIWKDVRNMLDKDYPDAFIIPEWCVPDKAIPSGFHADFLHWLPEYWALWQGESWRCLNGASNEHSFFDREGKGDITRFLNVYWKHYINTRSQGYCSFVLSNLNLARTNVNRTKEDMEIIYAFVLTMPGIPFIWYGEEIAMRQLKNIPAKEGAYAPRAGGRTPMQWNNGRNSGFSTASSDKLYLPVDTSSDAPSVAKEEADTNSALYAFKKLCALRLKENALKNYANLSLLYAEQGKYPLVYTRNLGKEMLLIILNPADKEEEASFTFNRNLSNKSLLSGQDQSILLNGSQMQIKTKPVSYAIYRITE